MKEVIKKSARGEYGLTLADLGKENKNIVVIDCDLSGSTMTKHFKAAFPERFFNAGIAEQDAVTMAVGLSTTGKIPFVSTFAVFASGRAWEQIRNGVCYPKFNVKIVATHCGITVGEDGASHQALEDIAIMRAIPNMTVVAPADATEVREVIKWAAEYKGPVYVRVSRANLPVIFKEGEYKFNPEKAVVMKRGKDVTVVTNGETTCEVMKAAEILKKDGISLEVVHVPVIKPLDAATIVKSAKKTNRVITVENHSIIGGLGGAVCEALSEKYPVKVTRLGIKDQFGQTGTADELMKYYGLTGEKLAETIKGLVK